MNFVITLSNIWNEFCDSIKSCLEWYLRRCSLIRKVWTELLGNFKYRLNSVIVFSEFSDNTRYRLPWIFTSFIRPMLNLLLFPWNIWIHHWISVKILQLSIIIMDFVCDEKVFLLIYIRQYFNINHKVFLWIYFSKQLFFPIMYRFKQTFMAYFLIAKMLKSFN